MESTRNILLLDIETRPDPLIMDSPEYWQHQHEKIEPNASIKDENKQKAWMDQRLELQRAKAALNPLTGLVACVGTLLWTESEPMVLVVNEENRQAEKALLEQLAAELPDDPCLMIGWNVKDFDVPFVLARCMLHGVKLPWWPKPRDYRNLLDLRDLGLEKTLSEWQYVLGGGFKEVEGADVLQIPLADLAEHCKQDLLVTASIAQRTQFCWGQR